MKKNNTPTSNDIWFIADKDNCYNFRAKKLFKIDEEKRIQWFASKGSIWIGGPCLGRWDD